MALPPRLAPVELVRAERERFPQYSFHELKDDQKVLSSFGPQFLAILRRRTTLIRRNPELGIGIFIGQVLQAIIASLVVQGALQKRVKSEKDFNVYQNQLTVMMNITMNVISSTRAASRAEIKISHFIDRCDVCSRVGVYAGNDNTESITNGVGFRNDISYGSIAPPVTYVLFAAFIILMKAATVYAMRGLKQAK